MHLVRFGKAVAPVSSSLQRIRWKPTNILVFHHKSPELANLSLLPGLEVAKIRWHCCFQQDWTCARVQALDCFTIKLPSVSVITHKAAFVFLMIDVYHRFNAFGDNLSFLKGGLGVRVLPEENVVEGEKYRAKAGLGNAIQKKVFLRFLLFCPTQKVFGKCTWRRTCRGWRWRFWQFSCSALARTVYQPRGQSDNKNTMVRFCWDCQIISDVTWVPGAQQHDMTFIKQLIFKSLMMQLHLWQSPLVCHVWRVFDIAWGGWAG